VKQDDDFGTAYECQDTVIPATDYTVVKTQRVQWGFDMCVDDEYIADDAECTSVAEDMIVGSTLEEDTVKRFMAECSVDESWNVVNTYFPKPGVTCEAAPDDYSVTGDGCVIYICYHAFRMQVVQNTESDSRQRRERRRSKELSDVDDIVSLNKQQAKKLGKRNRELTLENYIADAETLIIMEEFITEWTNDNMDDMIKDITGVDSITSQGITNPASDINEDGGDDDDDDDDDDDGTVGDVVLPFLM